MKLHLRTQSLFYFIFTSSRVRLTHKYFFIISFFSDWSTWIYYIEKSILLEQTRCAVSHFRSSSCVFFFFFFAMLFLVIINNKSIKRRAKVQLNYGTQSIFRQIHSWHCTQNTRNKYRNIRKWFIWKECIESIYLNAISDMLRVSDTWNSWFSKNVQICCGKCLISLKYIFIFFALSI